MATLFSDNFNRANGAGLGSNWVFDGGGGNSVSINTNRARLFCNDGSLICVARTAVAGHAAVADCKVSCTRITGSGFDGGPVVRKAGNTDYTFYYLDFWGTNQVNLYRAVQGAADAPLGSATVTLAANDVLALEVSGTNPVTLKAYRNGSLLFTSTDSSASRIQAAGQTGLHAWARNCDFDDFLVEDLAGSGTVVEVVGDASGAGSAAAVGAAYAAAQGAASGAGAAAAVGAAYADATGSASGSASAAAVGRAVTAITGSAAGGGSASATGSAVTDIVGSASGLGAASAAGAAIAETVGDASGIGSAEAIAGLIIEVTGLASGYGEAIAIALPIADAVGFASGVGSAQAFSVAGHLGQAFGSGSAVGVAEAVFDVVGLASGGGMAWAVGQAVHAVYPDPHPSRIAQVGADHRSAQVEATARTAIAPGQRRVVRPE